jgi:threonine dehydratase
LGVVIAAPDIADIRTAAERIRGFVRQTPLLPAAPTQEHPDLARGLLLKLECLQVTGSFKPRGAINAVLALPQEKLRRGIVTASGGNHGLAVAYAGRAAGVPATIFLPRSAATEKIDRLRSWGARVVIDGEAWDDSNRAALRHAEAEGLAYIHPFADPAVIAGQGTIALEILREAPGLDTLLVAIGGGGLIPASRSRQQHCSPASASSGSSRWERRPCTKASLPAASSNSPGSTPPQ